MGVKKKNHIRTVIQILFFVIVLIISIAKTLAEYGISIPFASEASLHSVCPFGGVESLYNYITTGALIQKIHSSSIILMYAVFILSLLFGPVFCAWICPFGSFQEFLGKLGKRIFKKRYNNIIPQKIDRALRFLRYFILILVIYNTAATAKLVFQDVDPYYALFSMFTGEVAITAYIALGITVLLSLIIERPFCKYVCPYGAMLGIFNFFRIFKIRRNQSTCTSCNACSRRCPMNIELSKAKTVMNHQCITCLECTSEKSCPVPDTVSLSLKGGKNQ